MKTLIVVNGEDAPGINTFIARYVSLALKNGDEVYGADGGFPKVIEGKIAPINPIIVRRLNAVGGSVLAASKVSTFTAEDTQDKLKATLKQHGIDNIVLFGDKNTLVNLPPQLQEWGIHHLGIPTAVENNIPGTEVSLGFDSACNYAIQSIDNVLATAHAVPGRAFMIETLGGKTGYIALNVAYGTGAHAVLLPEYEYTHEWLGQHLAKVMERKAFAIVVLPDGVNAIPQMSEIIPKLTGTPLHYIQLGHAQRGTSVSFLDRQLAYDMARVTYQSLREGTNAGIIAFRKGTVELTPTEHVLEDAPPPNRQLYNFINELT